MRILVYYIALVVMVLGTSKKIKPFAIVDLNSCLIFSQKHVSKCNYGVIIIGLGPDLELEICRE